MNNIYVKRPDISDIEKLDEYNDNNKKSIPNYIPTMTKENFKDKLNEFKQLEKGLDKNYSSINTFFYFVMKDDKIIGTSSIRINPEVNEEHKKFGGHIGYGIIPSYRKKGYGTMACHVLIEECAKLGLEEIVITCLDRNIGSSRIIENNLGVLHHTSIYNEESKNELGLLYRYYKVDVKKSLSNFDKDNYNKNRIKPAIEQICNIDRTNPNDFLYNTRANYFEDITPFIELSNRINSLEDIKNLHDVFMSIFSKNESNDIEPFNRRVDSIIKSKTYLDSNEISNVLSTVLRLNKVPTITIQSININSDLTEKENIDCHTFLEFYMNNKWYLFEPIKGIIYDNYDYNNLSLPNEYYVYAKGLNSWASGIHSKETSYSILKERFSNFDFIKYQNQNYNILDLKSNKNKVIK